MLTLVVSIFVSTPPRSKEQFSRDRFLLCGHRRTPSAAGADSRHSLADPGSLSSGVAPLRDGLL